MEKIRSSAVRIAAIEPSPSHHGQPTGHADIQKDVQAARNFNQAAEESGVKRIIYLGGLGEMADNLSELLRSRQMVAQVFQSTRVRTNVLRTANIIGAGGAPFEMLRHL